MFIDKRRKEIENLLKENGQASVKEISKLLSVSEATVRRDLTELKKQGIVQRSHGGAVLTMNGSEISIFARINKDAKEKEIVAYKTMDILPKFNTVFIDSSSTALALFERLDLSFKTVVTNNLQTALTLCKKKDVNLILLGGNVKFNNVSTVGGITLNELSEFYFDLTVCSCSSIKETGAYETSIEQSKIKKKALQNSDKKILVVDNSKFHTSGSFKVANLLEFDYIVTDKKPSERFLLNDNFIY